MLITISKMSHVKGEEYTIIDLQEFVFSCNTSNVLNAAIRKLDLKPAAWDPSTNHCYEQKHSSVL